MNHKYKLLTVAASIITLEYSAIAQADPNAPNVAAPTATTNVDLSGLTNPDYLVREATMKKIWSMGKVAVPALKEAVKSKHPELVARATILLRNIRIGIKPDTSDEISKLVQGFFDADLNRKKQILRELYGEKAYNNMLFLLNEIQDLKQRESLYNNFDSLGHRAARAEIGRGNIEGAIELLEMSPQNEKVLRSLAFLYVRVGKLEAKLDELPSVPEKAFDIRWKKMLLEESGDRNRLRGFAEKVNDVSTIALLDLEQGKPEKMVAYLGTQLPFEAKQGALLINSVYTGIDTPNTIASLAKFKKWAEKGNYGWDEDNLLGLQIMLYKNPVASEKLYVKNLSEIGKFEHFITNDEYANALKAMGVPTSDKEYAQWVKKTTDLAIKEVRNDLEKRKKEERQKGKLLPNKEKQEEYEISQVDVLKSIASLFQQVGDTKKAEAAILPFLKQLKEIDKETWQHTLSELTSRTMRMHSTALKLANEDAKTADDFWGYVGLFYNDQEYIETLWDALTSRKGVTPKQSFDDLAVLMHMRLGDEAKREVLIDSILKEAKKGGAEDYGKMMLSLRYMCQVTHNYLALQKIMKSEIAEEKNAELLKVLKRQYGYVCYLNKDWKEFMKYEKFNSDELHNSSDWYTKRSIAYRALGKNAEADKFIDQAILLTLGIEENLYTISRELAESGDFKRSNQMLTKIALVQGKNVTNGYTRAVFSLIGSQGYYFENEMWDQASAYSNISACLFGVDEKDFADFSPALVTQAAHMQRFSRGMQLLQQGNKKRAMELLSEAHEMMLGNGYLADHFYPVVRKSSLKKEYNQWVDASFNYVNSSLKKFPNNSNAKNTLAWILSRSQRRLDEGLKLSQSAVKNAPGESAYIDTLAEIYHAKGDKKKAVAWGDKSVRASLSGSQLGVRTENSARLNAWSLYLQRERFKQGKK